MAQGKKQIHLVKGQAETGSRKASGEPMAPPTVSGRWILAAFGMVVAAAAMCAWGTLCLLFWQGWWQLLYRPTSTVAQTPANVGLAFDAVGFAVTDAGQPRLRGWWIPAGAGAEFGRYTVVYLHGAKGNLGDCVDALAKLHEAGMNVLAFDYRGYGESQFVHPSEKHWREDADWALQYLEGTRQIGAESIVLDGAGLGANLALEEAAAHPELAGVVVNDPEQDPMEAVFGDARSGLVPARLMVRDRYDLKGAAKRLRIPSLWFEEAGTGAATAPESYSEVGATKMLVWLPKAQGRAKEYEEALARWLGELRG